MRRYFTPRCLWMHLTLLVLLPVFGWLTAWQLGRALGGNTLSWAYTFEWPLFAAYAAYVWWQLIHDQTAAVSRHALADAAVPDDGLREERPPGWALSGGRRRNVAIAASSAVEGAAVRRERFEEQTAEEAAELAAYNRYLASLDETADADLPYR